MCHVHGFPFPSSRSNLTPPSSYSLFPSGQNSYHRAKTNSTSSVGSASSGSASFPISGSISVASSSSHTSHTSKTSNYTKINADDPLGIMKCIDDSDDEYIVYEGAPALYFSFIVTHYCFVLDQQHPSGLDSLQCATCNLPPVFMLQFLGPSIILDSALHHLVSARRALYFALSCVDINQD